MEDLGRIRLGIVGLGRMGMGMTKRLLAMGLEPVVWDLMPEKVAEAVKFGAVASSSLGGLVEALRPPRTIWLMLPPGEPVERCVRELSDVLACGDIIVDGGNGHYQDDLRRAEALSWRGIELVDVGVSGGIWGETKGYCLMIGGKREAFDALRPLFEALSCENGYLYCGPVGAGHFVKMIHNGIEYGLMEAYAEGFALLNASPYKDHLELEKIARLWNQGSVIRSWLLELLAVALEKDPGLSQLEGYVEDTGEGRWTVEEAIKRAVPIPAIAASLFQRFRSRMRDTFSDRILAALRREFGGHEVKRALSTEPSSL